MGKKQAYYNKRKFYNKKKLKNKTFFLIIVLFFVLAGLWGYSSKHYTPNTLAEFKTDKHYFVTAGKITFIYDGDTFFAGLNHYKGNVKKIRVRGLDCFERKSKVSFTRAKKQARDFNLTVEQVFEKGDKARDVLIDLAKSAQNNIMVAVNKRDKTDVYARVLGSIFINGKNINEAMIRSGNCFKYRRL